MKRGRTYDSSHIEDGPTHQGSVNFNRNVTARYVPAPHPLSQATGIVLAAAAPRLVPHSG